MSYYRFSRVVRDCLLIIPAVSLFITTSLFFVGYGVATSIEHLFAIPRRYTYSSTLELLDLSSYAVMGWMAWLEEAVSSAGLLWLVLITAAAGLFLSIILVGLQLLHDHRQRRRSNAKGKSPRELTCKVQLLERMTPIWQWLVRHKAYGWPFVLFSAIIPLLVVLAVSLLLLITFMPKLGYDGANLLFQQYVINAPYCTPTSSREDRILQAQKPNTDIPSNEKVDVATCLELWKDGKKIAQGRYIPSPADYVILFDPVSGAVTRSQLEGTSLRQAGMPAPALRKLIGIEP